MSVSILLRGRNQDVSQFLASTGTWKVGEISLVGDKIYIAKNDGTKISGSGADGPGVEFHVFANSATIGEGFVPLDENDKIPVQYMPLSTLIYKGVWDATLNSPVLPATDITRTGHFYIANGTGSLHGFDFRTGDWALYNDQGIFEKSDNTDDVVTVNGKAGAVVLTTSDISEGTNLYYTNNRAETAARDAVSGTGKISYNSSTGVFSHTNVTLSNAASGSISGSSVVSQVSIDGSGHVSNISVRNLTPQDIGAASSSHSHIISDVSGLQLSLDSKVNNSDTSSMVVGTADQLSVARNITLSGDVTGSTTFNGSSDALITVTVVDDSHNHIISNVDGLQDALNLKSNTSDVVTLSGDQTVGGIKTFTSIPLLPNSSPTTDNQSTRKRYVDDGLLTKEPTISSGSVTQYWRGDKSFQTLNSSVVTEGTNLYFTQDRARSSISGSGVITVTAGVVSHTDSTTVRHVSDAEKTTWNAKVSEAPSDNNPYVRANNSWVLLDEINGGSF